MKGCALLSVAGLFSVIGLILSLTGNINCETIQFKPSSLGKSFNFPNLNMGLWTVRTKALYKYDPIFSDPYFATGNACIDYPDGSKFDTKWDSAIGLGITSWVLAGLATIAFCASQCVPNFSLGKVLAIVMFIVTLFQGLTLLVLSSDNCKATKNPVMLAYPELQQYYANKCSMSQGSKMNIAATVFYFFTSVALFCIPSPHANDDDVPLVTDGIDVEDIHQEEQAAEVVEK